MTGDRRGKEPDAFVTLKTWPCNRLKVDRDAFQMDMAELELGSDHYEEMKEWIDKRPPHVRSEEKETEESPKPKEPVESDESYFQMTTLEKLVWNVSTLVLTPLSFVLFI